MVMATHLLLDCSEYLHAISLQGGIIPNGLFEGG